jgi:hypothetical protein
VEHRSSLASITDHMGDLNWLSPVSVIGLSGEARSKFSRDRPKENRQRAASPHDFKLVSDFAVTLMAKRRSICQVTE